MTAKFPEFAFQVLKQCCISTGNVDLHRNNIAEAAWTFLSEEGTFLNRSIVAQSLNVNWRKTFLIKVGFLTLDLF